MSTPSDTASQAGPSRPRHQPSPPPAPAELEMPIEDGEENPRPAAPACAAVARGGAGEEGDEEEDEDRIDIKLIQSFANKVQYVGGEDGDEGEGLTGRPKIVIPKRGEKDFEPLQETVNLQEMMLQKSREALFSALQGVRGGNSKTISHALLTPSSPFPRILIVRGHLLDSIGISVRHPPPPFLPSTAKAQTYIELLPEEALYMLERGSLQIWMGAEPRTAEEAEQRVGEWRDEEFGVRGAVEMSVMQGFGVFLGREGLTWERYQAYAYLKRLGYTVHRTRRFLPEHFLSAPSTSSSSSSNRDALSKQDTRLPPFHSWWLSIPRWVGAFFRQIRFALSNVVRRVSSVGLGVGGLWGRTARGMVGAPLPGSLSDGWTGSSYQSLFSHIRLVPSSHTIPLPARPPPPPPPPPTPASIYAALDHNPYIPFFHVWKPALAWSKAKWDKGSEAGLARQRPDFAIAPIEARTTPMPTIHQLAEVFEGLPDEPTGPIRRAGPQYERKAATARPPPSNDVDGRDSKSSFFSKFLLAWLLPKGGTKTAPNRGGNPNPMGALRNGDRALIVAVNDSGNTGWVRFGRTGFADHPVF